MVRRSGVAKPALRSRGVESSSTAVATRSSPSRCSGAPARPAGFGRKASGWSGPASPSGAARCRDRSCRSGSREAGNRPIGSAGLDRFAWSHSSSVAGSRRRPDLDLRWPRAAAGPHRRSDRPRIGVGEHPVEIERGEDIRHAEARSAAIGSGTLHEAALQQGRQGRSDHHQDRVHHAARRHHPGPIVLRRPGLHRGEQRHREQTARAGEPDEVDGDPQADAAAQEVAERQLLRPPAPSPCVASPVSTRNRPMNTVA